MLNLGSISLALQRFKVKINRNDSEMCFPRWQIAQVCYQPKVKL